MAAPSGKPKAVYVPCAFTGAPPAPLPQASGPLPAEKQRGKLVTSSTNL